jgi:YD repeat-containing protein
VTGGNTNPTWTTYNPLNLAESVIEPATTAAPAASQRTWTTTYDGNGNPVAVSQPGGVSLGYAYDGQGDLASESGSGASAATDARSFTYDPDGRLAGATSPAGTDSYTYFDNGELKAASGPSGASAYTYNGDGLVSSEEGPGGTTSPRRTATRWRRARRRRRRWRCWTRRTCPARSRRCPA